MSPARRTAKRRNWPRGLREPRAGYYAWQAPDGRVLPIGRVPLPVAINEALLANQHIAATRPGLVERIEGATHTVAHLLAKMEPAAKPNTARSNKSLDKRITAALGECAAVDVSVRQCAELIDSITAEGHPRMAQALRARLLAVFARGVQLGWCDTNPAMPTANPKAPVQRSRLTLETYRLIRAQADNVNEWLGFAMDLSLVTGADRSSLCALQRSAIGKEALTVTRIKTGAVIEIPLNIALHAAGLELAQLLKRRTGVVSRYVIHHTHAKPKVKPGQQVSPDGLSHAFQAARDLAGLPSEHGVSFHEIRSLAARLYKAQGDVIGQHLLGHAKPEMTALYEDGRKVEPVRVKVGK